MKRQLKKLWHWLRMEDDNGHPVDISKNIARNGFRYSDGLKLFPLKEKLTSDDILRIAHKSSDGQWETCFITLKQLKEWLAV